MTATRDLTQLRAAAWQAFKDAPTPAKSVETWRRMAFSEWTMEGVAANDASVLDPLARVDAAALPAGVEVTSLDKAAATHAGLVAPYLEGTFAGPDFAKFEQANRALWRGGACVVVRRGVRLETPLHLVFTHAGKRSFPRLLVILEDGAAVSIVEEHQGGDVDGRSLAFSHVVLGRDARLNYFYAQTLPEDAVHFWHQRVELAQNAEMSHNSIMLGARRHKSELDVRLAGRGARSDIRGVILGNKGQFFDPHTNQRHLASDTASDMLFRTALKDDARSIYTGLLRIEKDALDCEAYQSNHNLLLSDQARADSTPILEILPDRVACKHGAAAGPLDPNELFYLMTRGIPEDEATQMLIMGFFDPVLSRLPIEDLRERLVERVRVETLR